MRKKSTTDLPVGVLGLFLILAMLASCDNPRDPGNSAPAVRVLEVTDLGVLEQDNRLLGRDGGYSGFVGNTQVWVFGDSVVSEPDGGAVSWLSSSYSLSSDLSIDDGLDVLKLVDNDNGQPAELFTYTLDEAQYNREHQGENCIDPCGARWALWPGPVVRDEVRQRSLLLYGKIHAEPGEFNFYGVGQSIALWESGSAKPVRPEYNVVENYPTLLFSAREPQFGPGAFAHEDYLYAYACEREGFDKPCELARVPLANVTDKAAWEYFNSSLGWSTSQNDLVPLFHGNDIMSVSYNRSLQLFVAVYSEPLSRNIKLRTAPNPQGPWSQPVQVTQALTSGNGNGWVYDALAHPEFNFDDGLMIYITYTRDNGKGKREMRLVKVEISQNADL